MASSKEYLAFVLEQTAAEELSTRAMMGEYLLYWEGSLIGGIYDDRLLVKPTPAALALLPAAPRELPYEGAKEMLLVEEVEDGAALRALFAAVAADLPAPRRRR